MHPATRQNQDSLCKRALAAGSYLREGALRVKAPNLEPARASQRARTRGRGRVVKCRESVVKDFRRSGRLKVRKKCREPRREKCRESVAKGALKVSRKPQVSQKCRESALKVSRKRSCKLETQTKRTSVAKASRKQKCRESATKLS